VALNANALTSVAVAKDHLGIPASDTSQDGRVERFINVCSDRIANYCNRQLVSAAVVEKVHGGMSNMLMLREWPIQSIESVSVDFNGQFSQDSVIDPSRYRIIDDGTVVYDSVFPYGYGNVQVCYTAGYQTIPGDLEMACLLFVEWLYRFRNTGSIGRSAISKGDEHTTILQDIPGIIKSMIDPFRRSEFVVPDRPARNV
jgi:hypothetical protein